MIVTKTLSTTLSNGVYPATYTWSSDCDSNLTYSNKTGTVNSDGLLSTDISFDDSICLQCSFYINVDNGLGCYANQDNKGIKPLTCGDLSMFASDNIATVTIVELGINCNSSAGSSCTIPNIPFGTYTLNITTTCSPLISNVTVNGITQNGIGSFTFIVTTDINNPYIQIDINCS